MPDRVEFGPHRRRILRTVLLVGALGVLALFTGSWAGVAFALVCGAIAAVSLGRAFDRRPVLSIDGAGLLYAPFSQQRIPWADIAAVAIVRVEQRRISWGKTSYVRAPHLDTINFSVKDPAAWSTGAAHRVHCKVLALGGLPSVQIDLYNLSGASVEVVVPLVTRHWPGTVEERTQRRP